MTGRAQITDRVDVPPDVPAVLVRDGNDAHLRLSVLLALHAGAPGEARDEAVDPATPWRARAAAAFESLRTRGNAPLALIDPDAAYLSPPTGQAVFDDATNQRERAQFFSSVLDFGAEHGWTFVRSAPRPEVTEAMDARRIATATEHVASAELPDVAPALWPLARWMVAEGRAEANHLHRLLSSADDPDDALVAAYEDLLDPETRTSLRRLALLREAHPINGVIGPFGPGEDGLRRLSSAAINLLRRSGALTQLGNGTVAIAAPLRDRLARRQALVARDETQLLRSELARTLQSNRDPEAALEAHRQAILGGSLQLALDTARFYASDLRVIAAQLSHRAHAARRPALYREAAAVYATIVSRFDAEDAYAWQYLGFNLERSRTAPDETLDRQIADAYLSSCRLADADSYNPLYHGRRLGFDARLGRDVRSELREHLARTVALHGRDHARWLILPARKALAAEIWADLLADYPWLAGLEHKRLPARSQGDGLEV